MGVGETVVGLLGFGVAVAMIAALVGAYLGLFRWMWKQRGRGFAEGWFEVAARQQRDSRRALAPPVPSVGPGERRAGTAQVEVEPKPPGPASEKQLVSGPPRYFVPREK